MPGNGYEGDSMVAMIEHLKKVTHKTGERLADAMTDHGKKLIARNTPVDTRALRESWERTKIVYEHVPADTKQVHVTTYAWTGVVFTEIEYAPYVEYGTGLWGPKRKKYIIKPKKPGGVLAFTPYSRTPSGGVILDIQGNVAKGGVVYTRYVMHPGSPGAHMIKIGAMMTEHEYKVWSEEPLRLWRDQVERGGFSGDLKIA